MSKRYTSSLRKYLLETYIRMLFGITAEALLEAPDTGSAAGSGTSDCEADPLGTVRSYLELHANERFPLSLLAGLKPLSPEADRPNDRIPR